MSGPLDAPTIVTTVLTTVATIIVTVGLSNRTKREAEISFRAQTMERLDHLEEAEVAHDGRIRTLEVGRGRSH